MIRTLAGLLLFCLIASSQQTQETRPLRLAIAGLVHGHVASFLQAAIARKDVQIVGVFDPDAALTASYAKTGSLAPEVVFNNLAAMLDTVKPEAVAIFTNTYDHAMVVEACASRRIPAMMEKPLAVNVAQARAILKAAADSGIPVMVNYETTWYKSHAEMWKTVKEQKAVGEIRKMLAMDGHQGPKEINVQPEFLAWLTDPVKGGAGALFDFGCYGANLMTWLMDNRPPLAVTAITQTDKPSIYPRVDDEATVLLRYPAAQGIIQGSWNWPVGRKDLEVYGQTGYAIATGGDSLKVRLPGRAEAVRPLADLPPDAHDSITYFTGVARGKFKPAGLNSLENNVIVVEILDAARESARTGRTVSLRK